MRRFEDKAVLVTGAASGIGRATALRLAAEGASLACLDLSGAALGELGHELEATGRPWLCLECDVSDEAAVARAVAAVIERYGRLDAVCNVAGILRADHSHELRLQDWERVLRVNLTGTFLVCRAAIPYLLKTRGAIVNTSSNAALGGHPWMAAYSASKGGILALTRSLSVEYVKQGLRVNAVCPGGVATPLHAQFQIPEGADPALLRRAMAHVPHAAPEAVAGAIAFLASADAAFMNGAELRIDGGALS
jgi:NAD(P)-dependent dehydrogenase (short-subunit alcohol dehydrogenase family)